MLCRLSEAQPAPPFIGVGGGNARANTKNGSAKVGRKGDPLLVSMVVASRRGRVADLVERSGATCLEKMPFLK